MRKSGKKTVLRWINGLNKIKQELNDNNVKAISELIKNNCNSQWHGFLINNNIIYKNEFGYYKWNDKIPITYKLIEKFQDFIKDINNSRYLSNKLQPTLFDKIKTQTIGKKANSRKTTIKWINSIKNIQEHLSKNNETCLSKLIRHFEIDNAWNTFLLRNLIIYKNNSGYYKWNESVDVDGKLIEKFRSFQKQIRTKDKQQPVLFDKPKINKRRNVKIEFKDKPKEQIGLIRKFLRWIY